MVLEAWFGECRPKPARGNGRITLQPAAFPRSRMLLAVSALLALNLQVQIGPSPRRTPVVRDSSADTARARGSRRNRGIRRPVTAEDQRTAFKDATAKTTLLQGRVARLTQDSALLAYDAMSYQRVSVGMGFSK